MVREKQPESKRSHQGWRSAWGMFGQRFWFSSNMMSGTVAKQLSSLLLWSVWSTLFQFSQLSRWNWWDNMMWTNCLGFEMKINWKIIFWTVEQLTINCLAVKRILDCSFRAIKSFFWKCQRAGFLDIGGMFAVVQICALIKAPYTVLTVQQVFQLHIFVD